MDKNDNIDDLLELAEEDEKIFEEDNEEIEEIEIEDLPTEDKEKVRDKIVNNNIVEEVKDSFLEYSLSVITSRAIPDLRDGLKPVHRRILWSMFQSGYTPDKPHRKSAKTVGEVMGNYHPHGDSSIYEAMVRLAQDFNTRCLLIDGHGNFGNIEGDGAAAMRYTEARLSKISLELLRDINKNTVDMTDNFDITLKEPVVLPSRYPNILVNGAMGIAVGMATNIPPHNLGEVIDGCIAYIDNPEIDTLELMQYIKGPDFPTGGIILGNSGIKKAYETGRGSVVIRSRAIIEETKNGHHIVITEVPYGVNTSDLKNKVAELIKNKVIEGITDYHTDLKHGVKITISLRKDANPQVILNNLYKYTNFQTSFGIILLMIDHQTPRTLSLKEILQKYVDFQKEVIIRRTRFELKKAEDRVHILEGLKIAQDNIDEVIALIKAAKNDLEAKEQLMSKYSLTEIQANAILELKLRRLTGLERDKIEEELRNLIIEIEELKSILGSEEKVLNIIKNEMTEIKNKYADERRTEIDMTAIEYIEDESLIPVENILVALTNKGYIKRVSDDTFKLQNRGGRGVKGMTTNEEDFPEKITTLSTHDYLLLFSNFGKVYRLKGYEIPEYSRQAKGLPIINLIPLDKDERITSSIAINEDVEDQYLTFITKSGLIKRTKKEEYDNIRSNGKIAINLKEGDELIAVRKTNGKDEIIIGASNGKVIRFNEKNLRTLGRNSMGVRGINIKDDEFVIGAEIVEKDKKVLVVTENGYGKKTEFEEYRITNRGGKGVKTLNVTKKNGNLVSLKAVSEEEELIIITDSGMTIRIPINQISTSGRNTQGVKLINLKDDQKVSATAVIEIDEEESTDETAEN